MSAITILQNVNCIDRHGFEQRDQSIVIRDGLIAWIGSQTDVPEFFAADAQADYIACHQHLVTPGLIDCHTHLVYAGDRSQEFQRKLQGESYTDIARSGGGILSTVKQTRLASEQQLLEQSLPRMEAMRTQGVTMVEIKSGYGLDLDNELKMLRVARQLGRLTGVHVQTTFLGAHTTPPEFKGNKTGYVDYICNDMLPRIAESGYADAVDVFCENIAFSLAETEQIFQAAQRYQLPIKCHAEQLSVTGASQLAAQYGALSCEHLEYVTDEGVQSLAKKGCVAVLLPGAYYFLREKKQPPVHLFRQYRVNMALATDCNPGSSPTTSLLLMMNMACQLFGFSIAETLSAVTYNAAKALGMQARYGELAVGKVADLNLWSIEHSAALCYYFGHVPPHRTMLAGEWIN